MYIILNLRDEFKKCNKAVVKFFKHFLHFLSLLFGIICIWLCRLFSTFKARLKRLIFMVICLIFCQSHGFPCYWQQALQIFFKVPYIISFLFVLMLVLMHVFFVCHDYFVFRFHNFHSYLFWGCMLSVISIFHLFWFWN